MVVVTGAAGFIGSAFVWELNQQGVHDIICVDAELGSGPKWKNLLKRRFTDYLTQNELLNWLDHSSDAQHVKTIFHIGACSSQAEKNMDFLMDNNFEYSRKIWNWCTKHRRNLVYASSCATYGGGEQGFDDTTDPHQLFAMSPYGYSKLLFDRWVVQQIALHKGAPPNWIGLRYSNVYGPHEYHKQDQSSVAFKAFHQIRETGRLKLFKSHRPDFKDGLQKRDFIYIKDVTSWMWRLSEKTIQSGIYNMGYGRARTWMDMAHAMFKAVDMPVNIEWIDIPENIRDQYQYFTEARMEKLLAQGMSGPKWSLEEGIADYVKAYLAQHDPYL